MKESKNKKTFDGKSGGSVGIGLALGLAIGLMMGVAMDNIPMWMCLGISIGLHRTLLRNCIRRLEKGKTEFRQS